MQRVTGIVNTVVQKPPSRVCAHKLTSLIFDRISEIFTSMTGRLDYKLHPCEGRQIRLLELQQDDTAGTARANGILGYTMHVVSLDDFPDYHAVSYVWGQENEVRTIKVDEATLDISANAERTLRNLAEV